MNVQIITIGDELLIGQVIDTNSAWMATELNLLGMQICKIVTVSDELKAIQDALKDATESADVVLMTGGLGPTKDDITKKAIADFLGVGLEFDQTTYDRILRLFEKFGRSTTPAHKEQCYMPAGVTLLTNKMGTAPGMYFDIGNTVLCSMPGVPYEMKSIMNEELLPILKKRFPGKAIEHRTVLTVGEGETRIAVRIEKFVEALPDYIKIAYLPGLGAVRLRLTGKSDDKEALGETMDNLQAALQQEIPEFVFGYGKTKLEEAVGQLLLEKKKTLTTAESCTGGHLAHSLTSIPGSSGYFHGSVVAYDNRIKENVLGVQKATLEQYGAVSEQTVREMVAGALKVMETDLAVATSGIAGPGGGTPEKPVGTIWLAAGDKNRIVTEKLQLGKDRMLNIKYTSVKALDLVRRFLLELI